MRERIPGVKMQESEIPVYNGPPPLVDHIKEQALELIVKKWQLACAQANLRSSGSIEDEDPRDNPEFEMISTLTHESEPLFDPTKTKVS